MRRQDRAGVSVGYTPRTWARLAVLLVMASLLVLLAVRIRQPRGWAWLAAAQPPPEEAVPPGGAKPPGERQSIDPDRDKLQGAADREPFLLENPNALVRDEHWQRQRKDADARYELLLYAKESKAGSLFADALRGIGHADLLAKPKEHRGEVIHIQGDLLWVRKMDLHRPGIGMKFCYQGLMTVKHPERAYWLLFTDLPPGLTEDKDWGALYLPNVAFAGYFHKIVAVEPLAGQKEPRCLPVLVGQSLRVPPTVSPADDLALLLGIFLAAVLPVGLIGLGAWWLYRRGDRSLRTKMAEVRQRAEARDAEAVAQMEQPEAVAVEPHRNGASDTHPAS